MKKTLLTAVSALAILGAAPAYAEMTANSTKDSYKPGSEEAASHSTGSFSKDAKRAWKNTKEDVSNAADKVSNTAKDAYEDLKQSLNDDNSTGEFDTINVDARVTVAGMIGEPVYNTDGERVAKVRDIILDRNGQAMMVILADGDFTGLGKLVAFDYDIITTRSADGDVIASLTEETIDSAVNFSYDRSAYGGDVNVIPSNGYSVSELLDGEVVNPQGETLAEVENVVLRNGAADQVIVSFGQTLGLGGKQAALSYADGDLTRNGDSIDMRLSVNEATQFEQFRKTALN